MQLFGPISEVTNPQKTNVPRALMRKKQKKTIFFAFFFNLPSIIPVHPVYIWVCMVSRPQSFDFDQNDVISENCNVHFLVMLQLPLSTLQARLLAL
jgi:hypothetical protein